MAEIKITQLPEKDNLSDNDWVEIVDTDDLTGGLNGTSKKAKLSNVLSKINQNIYKSSNKLVEINNLGGNGELGCSVQKTASNFKINRHLGGNNWHEILLNNNGEVAAGVDSPYKVTQQRVYKLYGYILIDEGVTTGTWNEFNSYNSTTYIGYQSKRTFNVGDTMTFTKEFSGDLDLAYVGDTDGSIMEIVIDGGEPILIDTYSPIANNYGQSVNVARNLPLKEHIIVVTNTANANPLNTTGLRQGWINAFKINSKTINPSSDLIKVSPWVASTLVNQYDERIGANGWYYVAQTTGTTGTTMPSHSSGAVSDGGVTWFRVATSSFASKEFKPQVAGSEMEYAYEIKPTGETVKQDIGGNAHGNEFLTQDVEVIIDNEFVEIVENQIYLGDYISIKQTIEDYYGDYATKLKVADVIQTHSFSNLNFIVNIDFELVVNAELGYFYGAMLPVIPYDATTYTKQMTSIATPSNSYDFIDYENSANINLNQEKDYIAWVTGQSFVPKGSAGVPSVEDGVSNYIFGVHTSPEYLEDYIYSGINCGLSVNLNSGEFTGYSSWLAKIYFQYVSSGIPVTFVAGKKLNISNTYFLKLY